MTRHEAPGRRDDRRSPPVRSAVAAALAAVLLAAIAGAAHAQFGDVGETLTQTTGGFGDTDYTPVAKASTRWQWHAGARFSDAGPVPGDVPEESVTPFELDFFAVAFRDKQGFTDTDAGFAGGAVCREPVPAEHPDPVAYTQTCERVPAIYGYRVNDVGEGRWTSEELPGADRRGYVGAIAWLDHDRVLAVGGDGSYPRRELGRAPGESDASYVARDEAGVEPNAAGMARAWIYVGGTWRELTDLPGTMRGLSAVAISPRANDCNGAQRECGFAGGLRQLWKWRDGRFVEVFEGGEPLANGDPDDRRPELFRHRVRDLRIATAFLGCPPGFGCGSYDFKWDTELFTVMAVTSGCCETGDDADLREVPRALIYNNSGWWVRSHEGEIAGTFHKERHRGPVDDNYRESAGRADNALQNQWNSGQFLYDGFGSPLGPWPERPVGVPQENPAREHTEPADEAYRETNEDLERETEPYGSGRMSDVDTHYGVVLGFASTGSMDVSTVMSPGAPDPGPEQQEPASRFRGGSVVRDRGSTGDLPQAPGLEVESPLEATDTRLTSIRLHDLDRGEPGTEAVGVLRATGQGAAFGPAEPPEDAPNRDASGLHGCDQDLTKAECDPNAERFLKAHRSQRLFKLPSYALNAVDVIDQVSGFGWAAGDHGALLSVGVETATQAQAREPAPPRLGSRRAEEAADVSAYRGFAASPTATPGAVPPLGAQPLRSLREPQLVPHGSTGGSFAGGRDEVAEIAMSRDGTEGWAVGDGAGAAAPTLHHYESGRWSRCDPVGLLGLSEPDEACAGLAALREEGVALRAIARVPLERDDDPANNDEFEAVAVGEPLRLEDGLTRQTAVARLRDGRWTLDRLAMEQIGNGGTLFDVEFSSADEGWIAGGSESAGKVFGLIDGEWKDCAAFAEACNDPAGRLPRTLENFARPVRLTAAGERVYLVATRRVVADYYPTIIYRDPGGEWRGGEDTSDDGVYNPADGGWDPGFYPDFQLPENQGRALGVSVAAGADGELTGWATGEYGGRGGRSAHAVLLRFVKGAWVPWQRDDAANDYLRKLCPGSCTLDPNQQITLERGGGAFIFLGGQPALTFNPRTERWEAMATPFATKRISSHSSLSATVTTVAPDGEGGFWLTARQSSSCSSCPNGLYYFRYTDRARVPVFEETANPIGDGRVVTALAAARDGTAWMGTDSDTLYRYDRASGWNSVRVPGWDPGRVVTNPSAVKAIALNSRGAGVAVGEGGRIASIEQGSVRLDDTAGTLCDFAAPAPPCGTGRDLLSAAVSEDGSAMVGGDALALLWRPAGGQFRRVEPPRLPRATRIVGISMPTAGTAYLATSAGMVFSGSRTGETWSWKFETDIPARIAASLPNPPALRGIAVGLEGEGYAVGTHGLVLERSADGAWKLVKTGFGEHFLSVALMPGRSDIGLLGGVDGMLATVSDGRFDMAHPSNPFEPVNNGHLGQAVVAGIALVPGTRPGEVEAWAALQAPPGTSERTPAPNALLHHASGPAGGLLDPARGVVPLPDAPGPREGELVFAAFGKQECQLRVRSGQGRACPEMSSLVMASERIARRVIDEIGARAERPGGPGFALFTGDVNDAAGGAALIDGGGFARADSPLDLNVAHRRWVEQVAGRLDAAGVPFFGAIGGQDLGQTQVCSGYVTGGRQECAGTRHVPAGAGTNIQWRLAMADLAAPWEAEPEREGPGSLRFRRLGDGALTARPPDVQVDDPDGDGPLTVPVPSEVGPFTLGLFGQAIGTTVEARLRHGADTHYAFDVFGEDDEKVARLVVVDTSFGSLAGSEPQQHPQELGGQQAWLERMLCVQGSAEDTGTAARDCSRAPGQHAIVVSNTPTYSYGPGSTETQLDGAAFEATLLRHRASVVVSGRLGWNGLYYALAPGLHEPEPGGDYPSGPPADVAGGQGEGELEGAHAVIADGLGEVGAPPPPSDPAGALPGATGLLPFVVASSAGGKFGPEGRSDGPAADGFWRGYSIVRLDASGDPRKTVVEQRPVFDWVAIRAQERMLRPGQRMTLRGYGREVMGADQPARYADINSPAITHRYDLLLADPERPWVPLEDANGDYVPVPAQVATIDPQTGHVRAHRGRGERTYAIGLLSVGEKAAAYPLAFEPRRSFAPQRAGLSLSPPARPARAPAAQPPLRAAEPVPPPPPPPPAAPASPLSSQTLQPPQPPQLPALPAAQPPPVPQPPPPPQIAPPPPPPAPPSVPAQPLPEPLALSAKLQAVSIVPSVNPPAPPPVNPAPPAGSAARKEAKQRQAATAKSEEGPQRGAGESVDVGQGPADMSPDGASTSRRAVDKPAPAVRRDRDRPAPSFTARTGSVAAAASFTPLAEPEQPSAWGRGAVYTGGLGLAALAFAAAWGTGRPRRRTPPVPAPALEHARRR